MESAGRSIDAYEGLVKRTASMFYGMVGLEFEDCCQELRIKVVKAVRSYDSTRSSMSERAYVYALLTNLVKDLKRDAARRATGRVRITHIEGYAESLSRNEEHSGAKGLDWFEHVYMSVTHEEVYGEIDGGFVMPATVSEREREIILMLVLGYRQTEIARELGVQVWSVANSVGRIRDKLADWRPSTPLASPAPPERVAA